MLTCQQMVELVTDYMAGDLGWRDRLRFQMHVGMCQHCRRYLRQLRATVKATGSLTEEHLDPAVRETLMERFRTWDGGGGGKP